MLLQMRIHGELLFYSSNHLLLLLLLLLLRQLRLLRLHLLLLRNLLRLNLLLRYLGLLMRLLEQLEVLNQGVLIHAVGCDSTRVPPADTAGGSSISGKLDGGRLGLQLYVLECHR